MKIEKKYLEKNHMTRSTEKLKSVKYILIKESFNKKKDLYDEFNYINNLHAQDEIYYSVHYIIGKDGKCLNIIPDYEVSYSTKSIDLNYYIISIECFTKNNGAFTTETIKSLIELINHLRKKYKISKKYILLHNDLTGSREPSYYVDNRYKFLEILDKIE